MSKLIHKYASILSLFAVLAGLAAASYLIPENPDSAVFRSGTLGTILVLACWFPVRHALEHANLRTLFAGCSFGFLYALALSLGAELNFYSGLLPGMGSMLRRIAVPFMAAPLLGCLAVRVMLMANETRKSSRLSQNPTLPLWAYAAILLLLWLPLLIAYFPGMFNYDFNTEYRQFYYHEWDDRHPMLYIVICYAVFAIGRLIDQPELAIFAVTLLRMITFAAALAYSCVFVQRRRAPAWALALMTAGYGLLPIFSVMSVSAAKDTPFAAALLVLSLLSWEALEDPQAFFSTRKKPLLFLLMTVFTWHMRKNGIAACMLLPLLIAFVRGYRIKMLRLCIAGAAASLLLGAGLDLAFKPFDQPSFQLYSLPAQQLVRAYNVGDMTEAEKEELRSWYVDDDWGLRLYPHLADAAKGYLEQSKLKEDPDSFMDLWKRVGKKNKLVYAEAFLMLNIGSWYPDDLTHATIYRDTSGLTKGYLQTDEYDFTKYGVAEFNPLPKVKNFYERICRLNEYKKYPILTVLFCTATPLWVIAFSCAMLIAKRKTRFIAPASGVMALWLSYLFGPCTLARYMLPLFCLAPALLILAFCVPGSPVSES